MRGERNFLAEINTARTLRAGELVVTRLAERRPWEAWERDERRGMAARAQVEAERLLAEHEVEPLDAAQEAELEAIMRAAAVETER